MTFPAPMPEPGPWTVRERQVQRRRIRYLEAGSGPPILLLHGFGAWAECAWAHTIPALSHRYRVLAPDRPGFGYSETLTAQDFTTPDPVGRLATFVPAFLRAVGETRATLVGNSFGGMVALRAALEAPPEVDALVLAAPTGLGRTVHWQFRALGLRPLSKLLWRPTPWLVREAWLRIVHDPAVATKELVDESVKIIAQPGGSVPFDHVWVGIDVLGQRHRYLDRLKELSAPVLVVWGEKDRIVPARHGVRSVARFPRARLVLIPDCGHLPMREKPEAFNAALGSFLDEVAPNSKAF
ncbi:MAG: alpha/beta fold hydrolase [Methanobacteriota archaeon]